MKKILTTLAISGLTMAAFAQGYVSWNVAPGADLITATNGTTYSGLSTALGNGGATGAGSSGVTSGSASGNIYYYELLESTVDTATPTTLTDLAANWTATGLHLEDQSASGRITELGAQSAAAVNYSGAGTVYFMLAGWSANLGTTYAGAGNVLAELQAWTGQVSSAYFGLSTVGTVAAISTSSSAGTTVWTAGTYAAGGLIANPAAGPMVLNALAVPEPGTLALAALGGASLLMFRRRK